MYLKRLELHGFKSFAKPTRFEFPSRIIAIVGPNGSGKSNCAEAMRWVLGEQSMKILRGKKGEDLIFNGSQAAPRLSKASVMLVLNNEAKKMPIDFDEVTISRYIYRDGVNEYYMNNSKVRLKDIVELLAHVGLGTSQHHIIGQGEADRILYDSPKERKEKIEDALGLRIYQIKRNEAERKLERTLENMKQVEALRKEIQPHLKFLRAQAEKFKKTEELRRTLEEKYIRYLSCEEYTIEKLERELVLRKEKPQKELILAEKKQAHLKNIIEKEQAMDDGGTQQEKFSKIQRELHEIREKRSRLERDIGRLEGMIEAAAGSNPKIESDEEVVSREEVEDLLTEIDDVLSSVLEESVIDQIYEFVEDAISRVRSFLSRLDASGGGGGREAFSKQNRIEELLREKKKIENACAELEDKEKRLSEQEKELGGSLHIFEKNLRERERLFYELETKINRIKDTLRSISIEEDRLALRKEEFVREKGEAAHYIDMKTVGRIQVEIRDDEREALRRDITRLKFKLEDAGGIDQSVIKELEEVSARDAFFEKELSDLESASRELSLLSKELAEKIEEDFKRGINKINNEFQKFFEQIFGGGKAELRLFSIKSRAHEITEGDELEEGAEEGEETKDNGIDVYVSLPRKKIRGLDMLSGGERALTSIALLFALTSVNPPPFLVLDEMDAALDENNSRRYGKMLRNLSKGTQLIIITHNRESMRNADVLYGVTMGSDGVSKVLSLKLEEAEVFSK